MFGGAEETAVVLIDVQPRVAAIDDPEERSEIVVEVVRLRRELTPATDVSGEFNLQLLEAVVGVVRVVEGQHPPRFSMQAKQQAIQEDQRAAEGEVEVLAIPVLLAEQSLGYQWNRLEHLLLQALSDSDLIRRAFGQNAVE